MLKKVEVIKHYLIPGYEAFHNYLNCSDAILFEKIDLSLIDDIEDYFYRVVTKLNKNLFIYNYMCYQLYEDYGIPQEQLYMIGDNYVFIND